MYEPGGRKLALSVYKLARRRRWRQLIARSVCWGRLIASRFMLAQRRPKIKFSQQNARRRRRTDSVSSSENLFRFAGEIVYKSSAAVWFGLEILWAG